jgi:hypothetical protein
VNINQCSGVVPCEQCTSRGAICAPQPKAGLPKRKLVRQPPAKAGDELPSAQSVNIDKRTGEPGLTTLRCQANDSVVRHRDSLSGSHYARKATAFPDASLERSLTMSRPAEIARWGEWSGATTHRCGDSPPEIHAEIGHVSNTKTFISTCMETEQMSHWSSHGAWSSMPLATVSDLRETLPAYYWGLHSPQFTLATQNNTGFNIHGPGGVHEQEMLSIQSEHGRPQFLGNCDDMFISGGPQQVIPELLVMQGDSATHVEEEPSFSSLATGSYPAPTLDLEPQSFLLEGPHEEPDILLQTELFSMPNQIDYDSMTTRTSHLHC